MKKLLTILSLLVTSAAFGQGFTYSYVDPCSKKLKTLYLENNQSVTVNYLGIIGTFTQLDFQNGSFSSWVQGVQSQVTSQPCDELKTQAQVTQNLIITQNIISTLTSITAASTMNIANSIGGASNSIGNSVDNSSSEKGPRNNNRRNNGNNQSNPGSQTNSSGNQNGGQGTGSSNSQPGTANPSPGAGNNGQGGNSTNPNNPAPGGSGTSQPSVGSSGQSGSGNPSSSGQTGSGQSGQSTGGNSGGSGTGTGSNPGGGSNGESNGSGTGSNSGGGSNGGSGGSGTGSNTGGSNGSGSGGQGGATDAKKPDESTQKQTESGGGNGGTTNSVSNAAEASSSNGGSGGSKVRVGSLIGTGDIVAIRSAEDRSSQFKGTMSMTKANTNNTRAKGFLLNFTTSINNSNLTFYGAFSNKTKTNTLIVANSSMVDFDRNFFNTTTALESKRFGKLSLMGGLNFTAGFLADESFSNLSGVGGGFYPFKVNKNLTGTVLLLGVYSPYTKFYEGKWWDSGILLVPFTSWDYAISKNFKYNVSFSGTYQVKGSVLNYQILTGGKILL